MTVVNLEWAQARRFARDRRLAGDDLRAAVIHSLAAVGDPRARVVGFVAGQDVPDLVFRVFVVLSAILAAEADPSLLIGNDEHEARIRKIARDLDVSVLRVEAALAEADQLAPAIDRYFGGCAS